MSWLRWEHIGSSLDGFNSNDFTQFLGKTDMVISQLSKGIFLADILKRLSNAGFVDYGIEGIKLKVSVVCYCFMGRTTRAPGG